MGKNSAGIMVYRLKGDLVEVLLVHPGGPFWQKKDVGAWSIPKGEFDDAEAPLQAAIREFHEETGFEIHGDVVSLGSQKQASGKVVHAWALEGSYDAALLRSNTFIMEWPKSSGQKREYPEVDRAGWFDCQTARLKLHKGQIPFVDSLLKHLGKENIVPPAKAEGNDDKRYTQQELF